VRDASVLADRIIERLQNKKARTAILVFDACRNNPSSGPAPVRSPAAVVLRQ